MHHYVLNYRSANGQMRDGEDNFMGDRYGKWYDAPLAVQP